MNNKNKEFNLRLSYEDVKLLIMVMDFYNESKFVPIKKHMNSDMSNVEKYVRKNIPQRRLLEFNEYVNNFFYIFDDLKRFLFTETKK